MNQKLEELDKMAYAMQALPNGLNMPDTFYFLTMRALYAMFATGKITAEQAKNEKSMTVKSYNAFDLVYRVGEHDMAVLRKIQSHKDFYTQNGCKVCRQLANEICGLEMELEGGSIGEDGEFVRDN